MSEEKKYFGKYRAVVVSNIDPEFRGRLVLTIPDVASAFPNTYAEPCVPLAGPLGPPMGVYMVPPPGAGVWVEFEQGDPNYPIWVGCRWGEPAGIPTLAKAGMPNSPSIILQTQGQNAIVISDAPGPVGGIMIKSAGLTGNVSLILNDTGIYLTAGNASIILNTATHTVNINNGALSVT
jgi:uncharacterized protein involved in type VI secretion and phage assembly